MEEEILHFLSSTRHYQPSVNKFNSEEKLAIHHTCSIWYIYPNPHQHHHHHPPHPSYILIVGKATHRFPIPNSPAFEYVCTAADAVSVVVLVLDNVIVVPLLLGGTTAAPTAEVAGTAATVTPVCTASAAGIEDRPGVIAPDAVVMMEAWPFGTG